MTLKERLVLLTSILSHLSHLKRKEPESLSDDDMEIWVDFVSESEENLNTIKVNLMELEQDPSNKEIINDLFRPFHTIKGVSGFLALTKIKKFAHATGNLKNV